MFSPVLRWLAAPSPWLLAMGLAGLWWLGRTDRRWPIVALPVLIAAFTFAVFFAEDRFRFHAMATLALCSGVWIDAIAREIAAHCRARALALTAIAASLGVASVALGRSNPPPPIRWDHIVWGYINMGKMPEAEMLAERIVAQQPDNGPLLEALGFTAAAGRRYAVAAEYLRRAVNVRPQSHVAHYNLAKVYLQLNDPARAAAEADTAVRLHPSADYQALAQSIGAAARGGKPEPRP
jgi:tetratricopeptide (TPR) repeat protein